MHQRGRRHHRLVGVALLLALLFAPGTSWARHTERTPVTIDSAYTLDYHEWRVSVWRVDFGLFDRFDVGTYTWPWLAKVGNLHLKWDFLHQGDWTFAARLGLARLKLQDLDEDSPPAQLNVIPVELMSSWRVDDSITLSFGGVYTKVGIEGSSETAEVQGALAVTNLQLVSTIEWRWSEVTAWTTHLRFLAYQETSASGRVIIPPPDAYTTIEFLAAGDTDVLDVKNAWSVTSGFYWSWDVFNIRLALVYGNWSFPAVNFVNPSKEVIPGLPVFGELDLYFRF